MLINNSIFLIVLAGIMNGSFVIPGKFTRNLTPSQIWCLHSIVGMFIIPWLILYFFDPVSFNNYRYMSLNYWVLIVVSGFIFGLGQIAFSKSIEKLGIALSFTINISLGVIIGSLYVVYHKHTFFSIKGMLVLLSVFLIVSGLLIKYMSEKYRINSSKRSYNLTSWWLLALFTGLTSGLQNVTFVTIGFSSSIFFKDNDSFWVWPLFLSIGAIPMFFGFLYLSSDSKASSEIIDHKTNYLRNIISILLMGILFTGSLFLYSHGMDSLTGKLQIVGWPTFMVGIIITTQIWGYLYREHNKKQISVAYEIASLLLLLASIIILSLVS